MGAEKIVKNILGLINDPALRGIATLRHYPMERQIYNRFGKCGFAIDLVLGEESSRRHLSILVEVSAKAASKGRRGSYYSAPGTIKCIIAEIGKGGMKYEAMRGKYRNAEELFKYVEEIRSAFYEKYRKLKPEFSTGTGKVGEEVFHAAGITDSELYLGV